MKRYELLGALAGVNLCAVKLAFIKPRRARSYVSSCLRQYDEITRQGLPVRDPVQFLRDQGYALDEKDERVEVPVRLIPRGGGMTLDEWMTLAHVTKMLRPSTVFEIGTYEGRTTCAFILNAPPSATIMSLDLQPQVRTLTDEEHHTIDTDLLLIQNRRLMRLIYELGLEDRYQQILCDSLDFDPEPHRGSVELGFIDGNHALPYVRNDTEKMATMMKDNGLVFWHDYGGRGRFRPLAAYLESLATLFPVYRVSGTTLAWAPAAGLKKLRQ